MRVYDLGLLVLVLSLALPVFGTGLAGEDDDEVIDAKNLRVASRKRALKDDSGTGLAGEEQDEEEIHGRNLKPKRPTQPPVTGRPAPPRPPGSSGGKFYSAQPRALLDDSGTGLAGAPLRPGPPRPPGSSGDPHFRKWDGGKFDFHGACDLVLLDAPNFDGGKGLTVQIRTEIVHWWSYISHVAIKIGEDILEVQSGFDKNHKARYWVNKKAGKPIKTQMLLPFTLDGHNVRYRDLTDKSFQFKVFLGDNQYIVIKTVKDWLRVEMDQINSMDDFSASTGMMGSFPQGNLLARDGVTRMEEDLVSFGQEWQVTKKDSFLFRKVAAPQQTQKCQMPKVQSMEQRRLLSGISQDEAEEICKFADDISDCIFDVVSTGDPDIAEDYM